MYNVIAVIVIVVVLAFILVKLNKSPKFDKFCEDLESGVPVDATPKEVIKDIGKAETCLDKQAKCNLKKAEKLTQESEGINDYLGDRGVGSTDKDKEDS